jgi:hypothetical protein
MSAADRPREVWLWRVQRGESDCGYGFVDEEWTTEPDVYPPECLIGVYVPAGSGPQQDGERLTDVRWFGRAAHLIVGDKCQFHMATQVGDYLVSTVGEYWPERPVREIHAKVHDPDWLRKNAHMMGDNFDYAYMKRFGFEEVGCDRKYETMVFKAGEPCTREDCGCGIPAIDGSELDFGAYNTAGEATEGHMKMVEKWLRGAATQPAGDPE